MAELKTKATGKSVEGFLDSVKDPTRREDCRRVAAIMTKATGAPPRMWGSAIVGFGDYRYRYASGKEGDWFLVGFSPRKDNLTLYMTAWLKDHDALVEKLGKVKRGGGCLYVNRLDDVHLPTLTRLVQASVAGLRQREKALRSKTEKGSPSESGKASSGTTSRKASAVKEGKTSRGTRKKKTKASPGTSEKA